MARVITKNEFMAADVERPVIADDIRAALESLEVGQGMEIGRDEWRNKSKPADYVANFGQQRKRKFKTRILANSEGWVVLRTR